MCDLPRQTNDGVFSLMLRPCKAEAACLLVDSEVPLVWDFGHYLHKYSEWWSCRVPLCKSDAASLIEVRGLDFDLLLPSSEFLARFSGSDGLVLHQVRLRFPDAFTIEVLDERNRTWIFVRNSLAAIFYLPHAIEYASFKTVEQVAIEKTLSNEVIRALVF